VYLVGKNAGMDVIDGDEECVIMREGDVLGRIGIIEMAKRARK
jgi:co-chaperonin GroES (HSP10)